MIYFQCTSNVIWKPQLAHWKLYSVKYKISSVLQHFMNPFFPVSYKAQGQVDKVSVLFVSGNPYSLCLWQVSSFDGLDGGYCTSPPFLY